MAAFLTAISDVITSILGHFTDVLNLFTTNPVLTVIFALFILSAVIGFVTKVSHAR